MDLSSNPLNTFPNNLFINIHSVKILSIQNIYIDDIAAGTFDVLSLAFINTTDYHICCTVENNKCYAERPWYISCNSLLPKMKMRIFSILVSVLSLLVNGFSFFLFVTSNSNKTFSVTAVSVNINDMLCGLYLTIIWLADVNFKDTFFVKEKFWRSGLFCFLAFSIILLFSIFSQCILLFLSFSRPMIVINPVNTNFKSTNCVVKSLLYMIITCGLISIIITFYIKFNVNVLPLSLCLPFIDPTNSIIMIKIITWFVVITQSFTSIVIVILYIILAYRISESKKNIRKSTIKDNSSSLLIVQLVIITSSNILCWFPPNIIYISAMFLSRYPTELVIWTTVGGLPINSIINPDSNNLSKKVH